MFYIIILLQFYSSWLLIIINVFYYCVSCIYHGQQAFTGNKMVFRQFYNATILSTPVWDLLHNSTFLYDVYNFEYWRTVDIFIVETFFSFMLIFNSINMRLYVILIKVIWYYIVTYKCLQVIMVFTHRVWKKKYYTG